MARATYTLEFELSYNTWTSLTTDWRSAEPLVIERGIEPGERIARVGRMELALHNPDGRYTPGHANLKPGFAVGIGVRLKASDGSNTYTLFYGRLAEIDPHPENDPASVKAGRRSPQQTRIVALDDMAGVGRARVGALPLIINATPRDLANRLVDASFTPPGLFAYWRLGHPSASKLGQTTTLPGDYSGKSFDAGQSLFAWAGDTWPETKGAVAALVDIC